MQSIYKYPVHAIQGKQVLYLPKGSKIIAVKNQGENTNAFLYAIVDQKVKATERFIIQACMTGTEFDLLFYEHIDTVMFYNGEFVLHYFLVSDIQEAITGDTAIKAAAIN